MQLVTIQLAKWRLAADLGYEFIDTTVKTNTSPFAPEWEMVMKVKDYDKGIGDYSHEDYERDYKRLIRKRYRNDPDWFHEFCLKDKVAIACFCHRDRFCHRRLVVEIIEGICKYLGIEFAFIGELF